MNRKILLHALALVACLLCSLGAAAAEAYACYTPSNTTLTFYYDNQRASRTGTTYSLNTGDNEPGWYSDGTYSMVTKVVFNSSFGDNYPTTTYSWFRGMSNLTSITDIYYLRTSEVTNMSSMFLDCSSLTSLDLIYFITENVKTMRTMFRGCSSLTSLDLNLFQTQNVTDMIEMFRDCSNLTSLNVGGFNTYKLTSMRGMFRGCSKLTTLDVTNFNTSNVTVMSNMFAYCTGLTYLNLGNFNTAKVKSMQDMFYSSSNLQTIIVGDGWKTDAVTSSSSMFKNCTSLVGGAGTIYNANHVDKAYAHIDGGSSNPGYLTEAKEAYACYTDYNTTLTFYYDKLRSTRTGRTYDLNTTHGVEQETLGYLPEWVYMWMFDESPITRVVFHSSFADARPTTTYGWFNDMFNLQSISGMEYLNTSQVEKMSMMFSGCINLTSLDVSNLNTSNVISMTDLFSYCSSLTNLDLSNFNTSKVLYMASMFKSCRDLTNLDLSNFNTSKVLNMGYMFRNCGNLSTIYVGSGWTTSAVVSSENMFKDCTKLVGGKGTTYDANHTDKTYAHIDGGTSNPGYLTERKETYACYTPSNTTLTFYHDSQRGSRTGTTYDAGSTGSYPAWYLDGTSENVTKVVFDASFGNARPTSTAAWFMNMTNLGSITGTKYLNTSEVTDMTYMYALTNLLGIELGYFNTSKVKYMYGMFGSCNYLSELDLSSFNTSQVTDMGSMFRSCSNLETIYVGNDWYTYAVTSSSNMFKDCTKLVGGKGTTYDANHVDKAYARIDGGTASPGYFTSPAAAPEPYACYTPDNSMLTFYYDDQRDSREGTTYNLNMGRIEPDWSVAEVRRNVTRVSFDSSFANARPTTTYGWFFGFQYMTSITGLHYLNTSEVTDMYAMFLYCSSLTSLDLSGFNTSKVTNMGYLFSYCGNLNRIFVGSGWSTDAVSISYYMFLECPYLEGCQGTYYDADHVDATYAHIDGGTSNPGYLSELVLGDVNGDGNIDVEDVTTLINAVLNGISLNPAAADVNGDNLIDVIDVTTLIARVLSGSW